MEPINCHGSKTNLQINNKINNKIVRDKTELALNNILYKYDEIESSDDKIKYLVDLMIESMDQRSNVFGSDEKKIKYLRHIVTDTFLELIEQSKDGGEVLSHCFRFISRFIIEQYLDESEVN